MNDSIPKNKDLKQRGSFLLNLLIGLTLILGPQLSYANSNLTCGKVLRITEELEFTKDDMLAYEMIAASVVFLMIKQKQLRVPEYGDEIPLRERDVTNINKELYEAFDVIFSRETRTDKRMTFVRIAEKKAQQQAKRDRRSQRFRNLLARLGLSRDEGAVKEVMDGINKLKPNNEPKVKFDYARLQGLYKADSDFVNRFLKQNTEAIVYNARDLSTISMKDMATKFGNPPPISRFLKYGALGAIGLSLFVPHMDDPMMKLNYLEDFWYVYLWQSSKFAVFTAAVEGTIYLGLQPIRSFGVTFRAPAYPSDYNEDIGSDVRDEFTDGDYIEDFSTESDD